MRIVILQPNLLGDAIMVTPLLRHLRKSLPQARLTLVLGAKNLPVRPMLGDLVDEVLPYLKKPMPLLSLLLRGRRARFDWLIDTSVGKVKASQLLVRLIGARHTIGPANGHANLYDTVISDPPPGAIHYADRCLLLAQPLGIPPAIDPHLELTLPPHAIAWAQHHWPAAPGKSGVLVNISGTGDWKFWGVDRYVALIRAARAAHPDLHFIIAGHARDQSAIDAVMRQSDSPGLPTTSDFAAFAASIARTDYLITPDTSIVHIAAAFRRPLLGLYIVVPPCDTCEPYRSPNVLLRSPTGRVDAISLEQGIEAFERLLAQFAPQTVGAGR